jgi:alanyl-tRNA synthetase
MLHVLAIDERAVACCAAAEFSTCTGNVLAIRKGGAFVDSVGDSDGRVGLVLDRTCFYAEQGGQVYDTGFISAGDDMEFAVEDCQVRAGRAGTCISLFWCSASELRFFLHFIGYCA